MSAEPKWQCPKCGRRYPDTDIARAAHERAHREARR